MPVLNGKWEGVVSHAMTLHSQSTREIQKWLQMNFIISLSRLELKHLMLPNPWQSFTMICPHTTKAPEITVADKFQFHTVSTHEIRKIIMSFSSKKAPGHEKITMSVIKDSLHCILPLQTSRTGRYCHQFFHLIGKFLRSPRYLRKEIMRLQTITAQHCYSQLHRGFVNEWLWINGLRTWQPKRGWPSIREATRSCPHVKCSILWWQIRHVSRWMWKNWHL